MKILKLLLLTTLITSCFMQPSFAQRFYDKERDEQAQEAKKLADQINSGSLFVKQTQNLKVLMRNDLAVNFMEIRTALRGQLLDITTWRSVTDIVNKAKHDIEKPSQFSAIDIQQAQDSLKNSLNEAKQALEVLKEEIPKTGDQGLISALDSIGGLESFEAYSIQLLDEKKVALTKELIKSLNNLKDAYVKYNDAIKIVDEQLVELKIPLLQIAIEKLQLEDEHWKKKAAIQLRRAEEEENIKDLIQDYYKRVGKLNVEQSVERVEETLHTFVKRNDREHLIEALLALHVATAIAARGSTPSKLVDVRLAHEDNLYSIRQSAITAKAYELTISTGIQRLALFHKGGVKPETIAQVIHTLAAAAIPAAIILK